MAVFRINKTSDYTVMSNTHLRDKSISLKAKGLLSLMFSLPPTWDYSVDGLCSICKEEKTAIESALKELKKSGYLIVTKKLPNETTSGRFEYVYDIFENPQKQEGEKQGLEKQGLEKQGVEILPIEIQGVENPPQLNTNILSTNLLSTYESNTDDYSSSNSGETELPPLLEVYEGDEETPPESYFQLHTGHLKCDRGLVMLSDWQFDLLCRTLSFDEVNFYVKRLSDYIYNFKQKTGKEPQIKSHYATILKWVEEDRNG